ncbi:hypothetical protein Tco_0976538 [Tanacetum coccineum]|uniref:Uncharacterized protein n=1 Tax=Tanacetum coccineum TaxID=301880 RepID=A0ABQ5EHM2_9ASTR
MVMANNNPSTFEMPLPVAICSGLVNPLAPRKGFERVFTMTDGYGLDHFHPKNMESDNHQLGNLATIIGFEKSFTKPTPLGLKPLFVTRTCVRSGQMRNLPNLLNAPIRIGGNKSSITIITSLSRTEEVVNMSSPTKSITRTPVMFTTRRGGEEEQNSKWVQPLPVDQHLTSEEVCPQTTTPAPETYTDRERNLS